MNSAADANDAHKNWQKYEKEIAENPKAWPAGQAERSASIWLRMGRNAAGIPDAKEMAKLPAFLRDHPDRPRPLNPSAEQCYLRAWNSRPDLLEAHEGLIALYRRKGQNAKAEKAARAPVGTEAGPFADSRSVERPSLEREEIPKALQVLQRAEKANPLNRDVAVEGRSRPICSPLEVTAWPIVSTRRV